VSLKDARLRFPNDRGKSLRDFIAECAPGAIIEIAPGRYDEPLLIDKAISIRGAGELTRISSLARGPVITVRAGEGEVELQSLALEGGDAEEGGALLVESGALILENLHLRRCRAVRGGGLSLMGGTASARLLRFSQLEAERGGAIRVSGRATLDLADVQISHCRAAKGGAIAIEDAARLQAEAMTLHKCRASEAQGGQAMYVSGSDAGAPIVTLHRVRFADPPLGRGIVQNRTNPGLVHLSGCDLPKSVLDEPGVVDLGANHWR
jgi:hypothetical protein